MGAFTSIAQGIGRAGSEIGQGAEMLRQARIQEAETQLRQLLAKAGLESQTWELGERKRLAGLPQYHSIFETPDGSRYAVMTDPKTGQPTTQQIYKSSNRYPEFRSLQEMEAWAVEHGDTALLKQAQDAIKATQPPHNVPATTEEWEAYKKALGHEPTTQDVLNFRRNPPREGEATLPDRHLKALADKWTNEGIKPPAKYQAAVEEYMEDHGMKAKTKLTAQEQGLLDIANQIQPKVGQLKKLIEDAKLTGSNDWVFGNRSALMQHLRMGEYKMGKSPDKLGADLIRAAAALQVMGAGPWVRIGRGKYMFETITQHLPSPTDTPKQLYDKANFLQSVVDELRQSLPNADQQDVFESLFGPKK